MIERNVDIVNKLGLHARAAAKLVQLLGGYKSNAWLRFREREINAKSIMGVMMLAAGVGSTVVVRIDGPDEDAAMDAAVDLFQRKFDEGQ
jgi:phosphocarrier protein HPr